VPSGWDQQSATCSDGSPVTNVDVSTGETVTCTFTNRKRGQLVVVKDAQPDDPQNFDFMASGGLSPSSFQLDDDSDPTLSNTHTFANVTPGSGYSLAETVPAGWDQQSASCNDGSPVTNIDVGAGETVTCTFTNRKRGQIVVVKDSQPNDPQNFDFTASGGLSPSSFQLDDDADPTLSNTRTFANVAPGSGYSIAEIVPSGWDQQSATCSDGSPVTNVGVSPGETVTCTFTNRKQARIVVVKDSQPDDPQDFSFTAGGGLTPLSFQLDDDSDPTLSNTRTFANVAPGSGYSIAETVPTNWDQLSATCSDGSPVTNVDVSTGETVTCTFVNQMTYARPLSASPVDVALVPSFRQCGTGANPATGAHAPPLAVNSCTIGATSTVAMIGPQSVGSAQLTTVPGDGDSGNGDQADIQLDAHLTDVVAAIIGGDYNPNPSSTDLTLITRLRVTDDLNCSSTGCSGPYNNAATASEVELSVPVDCTNTPDTGIGADCAVGTTADALVPDTVREGKGTITQVFRVRMNDAGANGIRGDSDDRLFVQQGVYIP